MLRLYCFSGTGNARNVATWIASTWRAHDRDVEVVDLASSERRKLHIGPDDEIGLASPTLEFYARQSVRSVVNSALMIAVLMLAYRLLHRALRLRAVERVAVWSSLTHFAFWRRYRPPRAHVGAPKHDSLKPRA